MKIIWKSIQLEKMLWWLHMTYIYRYIYIFIYTHLCVYRCVYTYVCIHVCVYVCTCVYIYIYIAFAAATAAKSLQSCLTLCDPIDGSPPGSPVPGILQARTVEWVAISFSNAWKWKVKVKSVSGFLLLATPWTTAYQAPPPMGFSSKSTGVGCHCLLLYSI